MIRFGVFGAGMIAHKFCGAIQLVDGCCVTAIASRDLARAKDFADQWNIPQSFGSYEMLLKAGTCDIIYIATTNQTHRELCTLALTYKHHVLCEKPLALHEDDAISIFALAKKQHLFIMEAMWSFFLPGFTIARQWIREGRIGQIHFASMCLGLDASENHRVRDKKLGGGILYDLGVYPLELIPFLLNRPIIGEQHIGKRDVRGVDQAGSLILDLGDCLASVQTSMNIAIQAPSILYGTEGHMSIHSGHRAKRIECYDTRGQLLDTFEEDFSNGFEYMVRHVVTCLTMGVSESPIVPHQVSAACSALFDKILSQAP